MRYDPDGRFLGAARDDHPATIDRCRHQRDLAMAHAVPLTAYLEARRDELWLCRRVATAFLDQ